MESKDSSPEHHYETVYKTAEEVVSDSSRPSRPLPIKPPVPRDTKPALPPKTNIPARPKVKSPPKVVPTDNSKLMSKSMNDKIVLFSKPQKAVPDPPTKRFLNLLPFTGISVSLPTTPVKNLVNLWTPDDERQIKAGVNNPSQTSKKAALSPVTDTDKTLPTRPPRNFKKSKENILVEVGIERDETGTILYVTQDQLKPLPRLNRIRRRRGGSDTEDHLRSTPNSFARTPKTRSLGRGVVPQFSRFSSISSLDSVDSAFREMSGSGSTSVFGSSEFQFDGEKPVPPPRRRRKSEDVSSRMSQVFTLLSAPVLIDTSKSTPVTPNPVSPDDARTPIYAQIDKSRKIRNRGESNLVSGLVTKFETSVDKRRDFLPLSREGETRLKGASANAPPSSTTGEKSSGTESDIESNIRKIENSFVSVSLFLEDGVKRQSKDSVPSAPVFSDIPTPPSENFSRLLVSGSVVEKDFRRTALRRKDTFAEVKTFLNEIQLTPVVNKKEASPSPSLLSQDSLSSASDTKRVDDSGSLADISDMTDSDYPRSVRERIASIIATVGNGTVSSRLSKARSRSQLPKTDSSADESGGKNKSKKFRTLPRLKSEKKMKPLITVPLDIQIIDPKQLEIVQDDNQRDSFATGSDCHSVVDSESDPENTPEPDVLTPEEKRARKVKYIAAEIVSSESVFVECLRLLNDEYKKHIVSVNKEEKFMPEDDLARFLSDLPSLLTFSTVLLSDLRLRLENWDKEQKIADIITKVGPFLKLYSVYIRDFEYNCSVFDEFRSKYPKFDQLTREFERSEKCSMLGLKHYMLKPVQRIPQYRLLLQDYLDHLEESSADYQDTVQALKIVSDVAEHANNSVKQEDNFHQLLKLQSRLRNCELIRSGRFIRKEGELLKLSRKTLQPRYFILLNDCLLYTSYQGSPPSCKLRVNHELPLVGMKVDVPVAPDYPNEFIVISTTRSLTLIASSPGEREDWLKFLREGLTDAKSKRKELAAWRKDIGNELEGEQNVQQLGKHAPVWIPDSRVTMCQLCCSSFSVTFRRHHCRACGKVVCTSCSGNQAPLEYMKGKKGRVCDDCYLVLLDAEVSEEVTETSVADEGDDTKFNTIRYRKKNLPSRLVEVSAKDGSSQMSGYLWKRNRHTWKRFWFVLKDRVLYTYKASEDVAALETAPVLGYKVQIPTESLDGVDATLIFKLAHLQEQHTDCKSERTVIFHAEDPAIAKRWIAALSEATVLRADPV